MYSSHSTHTHSLLCFVPDQVDVADVLHTAEAYSDWAVAKDERFATDADVRTSALVEEPPLVSKEHLCLATCEIRGLGLEMPMCRLSLVR